MDIKINDKEGSKKEICVTLSVDEMEEYITQQIKEKSTEVDIKGFRKGFAPRKVIENAIGEEKIYQEAAEKAIRSTYPKIIEENNFFTISAPHIEITKCAPGNDLEYKAVVYVFPEIKLPDYKKIAKDAVLKDKKEIPVSEKEIDKVLKTLQNMKAEKTATTRGAKKGDLITINFKGTFQEKEDKKIEEENFQLILGEEGMQVLEGFEENIYNMTPGEEKDFSLEIPNITKNNEKEKVNFHIKVVNVMERKLPEINDSLAKLFNIESLEKLKEQIKKDLTLEKEKKMEEQLKTSVLRLILGETKVEVPEILVEKELDNMIKTIENQLKERNSSLDDYLQEINKTLEEIKESWKKQAEENVSYALILHKIGDEEGVVVEEKEIEDEVKRQFQLIGKKIEDEKEENINRIKSYTHDVIKNQKIFNLLLTK